MTASLYRVVLPQDDMPGASAFWSELLQLEVDALFPTRQYVHTAGAILALVDPREHDKTARPNADCVYLRMPDLDAAFERAVRLGARMPTQYPGRGIAVRDWGDRSFYCFDPFGNPVCLIDDVGSDVTPAAARYTGCAIANLSGLVLPTTSLGRSGAFYEALLGIEPDTFVPGRRLFYCDTCVLQLVDPVEHARGHELDPVDFRPNDEITYFAVADLGAAWETAQKLEASAMDDGGVGRGIQVRPWGERSFYVRDPSGNPVCFVDDTTLFLGNRPADLK